MFSQIETQPQSSSSGKHVLYLTFDGVLEPLGQSQVLRYIYGLSDRGFLFSLISLEREKDLSNIDAIRETEELVCQHQIQWIRLPYQTGGAKSVLKNIYTMARSASSIIRKNNVGLVHARSYVPTLIAWYLRLRWEKPYIFDARGYWIDEKAAEGQWFTHPRVYTCAKWLEKYLFQSARAIVTLTAIMADDLRSILKPAQETPIVVIPTCADFDRFSPDSQLPSAVPVEVNKRLKGKLVIGMMGAINTSYCVREGMLLFSMLRERRDDAHLLCVTQQTAKARMLVHEAGISDDDCTISQSSYQDMPDWMRMMDWGLLLLNETFAKRGSMPTKLAEMLACGVRPIQYGCNREVAAKVREAGSGIVLPELSNLALERAAETISATNLIPTTVLQAREDARSWCSVEYGVDKYESLLTQILTGKRSSR